MTMKSRLHTTTCRALLAALALAVSANLAAADEYEVSIGSTGRWLSSDSMDAITADDSHAAFSLGAALRLDRVSIPLFHLYLDAMLERGSIDGDTFQRIQSETSLLNGMIGARAERRLSNHLFAFGRAAFGMARVSLSLTDEYSNADAIKDHGLAGTTYFGGGLDLAAIRKPPSRNSTRMITIGLRAEAGYSALTSVHMRSVPEGASDEEGTIRIPTYSTAIGDVNLSAWSFRLAFFGRF